MTALTSVAPKLGARDRLAIAGVLGAMTMDVLDAAIANIALPTISRSLAVTPAMTVRIVTAYQLGLVVTLLPAAALGEDIGFRRVFGAGTMLFMGASILCALSPSLTWLVAARFVQGMGGAAIMALGVALLRHVVPQQRLGAAIGWNALTVALSSAVGPTIGATILSLSSWPWLFGVNLPIGVLVLLAARALPELKGNGRAVDKGSVALNAGAFGLFVAGAEHASSQPMLTVMFFAGAIVLGIMLVRREAQQTVPLIPLDLLRRVSFRVSVIASILCFMGQAAALVALPFYLQGLFGLSSLMAGLYLSSWPLTVAVAGPLSGRLADHVPTGWLCLAGGLCLAVGLGAAANWPSRDQPFELVLCLMVCGLGFGLFNVSNNRNLFLSAPMERSGAVGGMQSLSRLTGQMLGALMMAMVFAVLPLEIALRIGLTLAAVFSFAAGFVNALHLSASQ